MRPTDAIELGKKHGAVMVDLKFCDLLGQWQHTSVPFHRLTEEAFEDGFGFDGSSIRGWKAINESDMLLLPDHATSVMDPFTAQPTLSLICNIADPITRQPYGRDPRYIARKAEAYLKSTMLADTIYCGPESKERSWQRKRRSTTSRTAPRPRRTRARRSSGRARRRRRWST